MTTPSSTRLTRRGRGVLAAVVTAGLVVTGAAYVGRAPDTAPVAEAAPTATETAPDTAPVGWSPAVAVALSDDDPTAPDTLVERAPITVLVADGASGDELRLAAWLARRLVAPVVAGADEVAALDPEVVVAVGGAAVPTEIGAVEVRRVGGPADAEATDAPSSDVSPRPSPTPAPLAGPALVDPVVELPDAANRRTPPVEADLTAVEDLLSVSRGVRSGRTLLVTQPDGVSPAEIATATALGHAVVTLTDDPRADAGLIEARRLRGEGPVLTWGSGWDTADGRADADLLAVVRAGHELPGGGFRLFPDRRMIALYGHPEGGALGLLGEQPPAEAVARTQSYVDSYAGLFNEPVIGAFDLITTVASAGAGPLGDYSRRTPIATLRPWVDAARDAGFYVVLDLQSGRTDFLTQAKEYEELLLEPHVGIALDPEWRLQPNERHLRQIGSVSGHEVNEVIDYVADLTRDHALPQKLLVVHQFKLTMIRDRDVLDATRPEVAVMIHMDGQGSQGAKNGTYATLVRDAPEDIWWGWKNFLDEDLPGVRSPEATAAVAPAPWFISYQ